MTPNRPGWTDLVERERRHIATLAAACEVVARDRQGRLAAIVLLPMGPAHDLLAPTCLTRLAQGYGVRIDVLDAGSLITAPSVRITRLLPTASSTTGEARRGARTWRGWLGGWLRHRRGGCGR